MAHGGTFSIKDFADFSRTTSETLRHYDRIGLLSPMSRGNNKYRYYSGGQLAVVNVIHTLQELGMTLAEIKAMKDKMSPALVNEVLEQQKIKIDQKIESWAGAQKLLHTLQKMITSVLNVDEDKITIQYIPAETVMMGDLNDYSRGGNDYDALTAFYHKMHEKHPNLNMNYPVWAIFSEKRIKRGDWVWPDRYYFYNPEGRDVKPAAFYAIGYQRGGYGQTGELYQRLISYIQQNEFEICGDVYEEYPLNEVCMIDSSNYLVRVMITVRKKQTDDPAGIQE